MKRIASLSACLAGMVSVSAGERWSNFQGSPPPPPAAPLFTTESVAPSLHAAAATYTIGEPTAEEQLYLELINRARLNPPGEGVILANLKDSATVSSYAYFHTDLSLMQSQFAILGPVQPLAFSPKLALAARRHSLDMLHNVLNAHDGSDGSTPKSRIEDAGYFGSAAENVYANAESPLHGHAGFEVDWGDDSGGMQSPPRHRENIHNGIYREVGIGVVNGNNSNAESRVGPQLVTQDLGVAQNSTPFITGVAYFDLNGNKFYDPGEGVGNIQVTVNGSNWQGVTARSGGYAVPVPGNGNYTLSFSGPGLAAVTQTVSIIGSKNTKLDFTPVYIPPVITGPFAASVGRDNGYAIATVIGATEYEGRSFQKIPAASEGAENGRARVTVTQSGTYDVFQSIVVKSGSFAFHLVTPVDGARSQFITLTPTYFINDDATISFQGQLGFSTPDQHAQVQVSSDGLNWLPIYNRDGNADQPETTWQQRTVSLTNYLGKAIRIRFALEFVRGVYISSTDLNIGWLIDDIQFANAQEIVNSQTLPVTANSFQFHPEVVGDFSIQARARTGHEFLDWGPAISVRSSAASGPAEFNLNVSPTGSQLQLNVNLTTGATPAKLTIESRDTLNSTWQPETTAFQTISASQFRATLSPPITERTKFYRVRAE